MPFIGDSLRGKPHVQDVEYAVGQFRAVQNFINDLIHSSSFVTGECCKASIQRVNSEIPSSKKEDIMKYLGQVKVRSGGRGIGTEERLEMGMPELEPIDAILSGNDVIRATLPSS